MKIIWEIAGFLAVCSAVVLQIASWLTTPILCFLGLRYLFGV